MPVPPEGSAPSLAATVGTAIASLAAAVALAELYRAAGKWLAMPAPPEPWLAAAIVHTALAALVVARFARRGELAVLTEWRRPGAEAWPWMAKAWWRAYLPAVLVLAGAAGLAALSRLAFGPPDWPGSPDSLGSSGSLGSMLGSATAPALPPLAWVLWVPVVEELVFRGGLDRLFRPLAPRWLGRAWFTSLTFALVHGTPTLANVLAGRIGLPLGPFLLGLASAALVRATGRLAPAVVLHAACNTTATVFVLGDGRWLDWLGFLYG